MLYLLLIGLAMALYQNIFIHALRRRLRGKRLGLRSMPLRFLIPFSLGLFLAWRFWLPLISPFLFLVGLGIGLSLKEPYRSAKEDEVAQLARLLRAKYRVVPSLHAVLEEAAKRPGKYSADFRLITDALYLGCTLEEALGHVPYRGYYFQQLLAIFGNAPQSSRQSVLEALEKLANRVDRAVQMREETHASLLPITGQIKIVQCVGVGILFFIAMTPGLREGYRSLGAQLFFIILVSISVGMSALVENKARQLLRRSL